MRPLLGSDRDTSGEDKSLSNSHYTGTRSFQERRALEDQLTNPDVLPPGGPRERRYVDKSAFLAYGSQFAFLLGLPFAVTAIVPMNPQPPERYQPLFAEGCVNTMAKRAPARFSGSFEQDFTAELFRGLPADPPASQLVRMADFWFVQLPHSALSR